MTGNKAQIDYWNGPTGQKWAKHNSETDRNLSAAADAALKLANALPGERVLDIGCGAGVTSFLLAERVGPEGHVTGVDVSQPMLALARSRTSAPNIDFIEADAALHPFAPEYDLIFSRFGVMFFVDPAAAFSNIRKGAAKDGRLAFVCWRVVEDNEWVSLPYAAARPVLPEQKPVHPHAPGPFAFADADRLRGILSTAGFSGIGIEKFDGMMELGASPQEASFQVTQLMGPTARALRDVDDATRAKAQEAVAQALAKVQTGTDDIRLGMACWLVSAKA
ncbi:MAG: class I SAM-dependent methyltransferase [Pseudomonadota bacterium]